MDHYVLFKKVAPAYPTIDFLCCFACLREIYFLHFSVKDIFQYARKFWIQFGILSNIHFTSCFDFNSFYIFELIGQASKNNFCLKRKKTLIYFERYRFTHKILMYNHW